MTEGETVMFWTLLILAGIFTAVSVICIVLAIRLKLSFPDRDRRGFPIKQVRKRQAD